jgi:hypothetical protein
LVRQFPKSAYHATLWHGLREYYFKNSAKVRGHDGQEIRDALGTSEPGQFGDPRLESGVRGVQDQEIRVEDLLRALSEQAGVPLNATAELRGKTVRISVAYTQLRGCMTSVSYSLRSPWWPQGKGYLLSKEPPDAGNPRK